jgi:membrane protein YqaA with SNARE-associated domain
MKKTNNILTYDLADSFEPFQKRWRGWRWKNTTLLVLSLAIFLFLSHVPAVDSLIRSLGNLGFVGAFIAGIFFVSTYTALPAGYVLFELAKDYNALEIALVAGIGSMLGDYIIFRFIKDRVMNELKPFFSRLNHPYIRQLFRTPYFAWMIPFMGAAIIASPFPDEVGIAMLGASKMKNSHFMIVTYMLNVLGIFFIVILGKSI